MSGWTSSTVPDFADAPSGLRLLNQPGSLVDYNAHAGDRPLVEAVKVFEADWAHEHLVHTGACVGSDNVQYLARQANRHLPELNSINPPRGVATWALQKLQPVAKSVASGA